MSPAENAKLIILGPSNAIAVNPKYFEKVSPAVYNFAQGGATPSYNKTWYRELFKKHYPKPEIILYSADWFMFYGNQNERFRKLEYDSEYFPADFFMAALLDNDFSNKDLLLNRFPILKYRDGFADMVFGQSLKSDFLMDRFYKGGVPFRQKDYAASDVPVSKKNDEQVRSFEEMLDLFRADGIQVILFFMPEYLPELSGNIDYAKKAGIVRAIAKNRKLPLLDYNDEKKSEINSNVILFNDFSHLNSSGSEKFSEMLANDVVKLMKAE